MTTDPLGDAARRRALRRQAPPSSTLLGSLAIAVTWTTVIVAVYEWLLTIGPKG